MSASLLDRLGHALCAGLGALAAAALFCLMTLTFVDVVFRKFWHAVPGALEISEMLLVMLLFCALPLVSWQAGHVSFELADSLYRGRLARWSRQAMDLISAVALGLLAWAMRGNAMRTLEDGDVSDYLRLPIGWFVLFMAAMLALAALVHLARCIRPATQP